MKMKQIINKKNIIQLVMVVVLLISIIGVTYAWLTKTISGKQTNLVKAGNLNLEIKNEKNEINLSQEKAEPISDEEGLASPGYEFTISNTGSLNSSYVVYLDDFDIDTTEVRMNDKHVRYSLVKNNEEAKTGDLADLGTNPNRILDEGNLNSGSNNTYVLKLWISSKADNSVMNTVFSTKLRIKAEQQNIPVSENKKEINVNDNEQNLNLEGGIENYTINNSDNDIATIDSEGKIVPNEVGTCIFRIQNKLTGAKQTLTVNVTKTINVNYVKNSNVESIKKEQDSCKLTDKGQTSCNVILPTMEVVDGNEKIGWSQDKDATTGTKENEVVKLSKDTTYYTITKKADKKLTVTFKKQGLGVTAIGKDSLDCTIDQVYNDEIQKDSCDIILPSITVKDGYTALGWSKDENAEVGDVSGTKISVKNNEIYYSISKKDAITYTNKFYLNGSTKLGDGTLTEKEDDNGKYVEQQCTIDATFNNNIPGDSCTITSPKITSDITPNIIGYNQDKNATISTWAHETERPINKNDEYYAITRADSKQLTATFVKQGLGVTNIGEEELTCTIDSTFNGNAQKKSCKITLPTITVKDGYSVLGWSTEENADTGEAVGSEVSLTADNTPYYSISKKDEINLSAKFYLNGATKLGDGTLTEKEDGNGKYVEQKCTIKEALNNNVQDENCTINIPTIDASSNTPEVLGYALSPNSTIGEIKDGIETTLTNNVQYYAITKNSQKNYKVVFNKNSAKNQDGKTDDTLEKTCSIPVTYNGIAQSKSCNITSPTIEANDNTPTVLGYSLGEADKHDNDWSENTEKSINSDSIYYAQTYKDSKEYTIDSYNKGSHVSEIGTMTDSNSKCSTIKTWNGLKQDDYCTVEAPSIKPAVGYTSIGWNMDEKADTGFTTITLNSDNTGKTWYANALANSYKIQYYDGINLINEVGTKVDESVTLKTETDLGISKLGYNFKGWATSNGGASIYTGGQQVTNLTTSTGDIIKLYTVWADDIKPICTWSNIGTTTTQNSTTMTLDCTDLGSGISNQQLTTDNFTVSENGQITGISSPNPITNGYKYIITVKGLRVGNFNVSLKANSIVDNAWNSNIETQSSDVTVNGRTYTVSFTKGTGVSSISSTSNSCTTTGTDTTCTISTYPTITTNTGYISTTWYDSTTGKDTGIISGGNGTGYPISQNTTMVAQAKQNYTGISSKTYSVGENVTYGGQTWKVISDNGDNTTMVLANNYTTGTYGSSSSFTSGNNAYTQANTNFVNSNATVKNDIAAGGILLDSNSNSYIRLPLKTELSTKISNNSSTNFWTMTPSGSSLYYGLPNGGYTYTSYYYSGSAGPFYNGYGTSSSAINSRTLDTSVSSSSVSYPTVVYNSSSATYSYSPYQSNIGTYSDSYSNFTATNSYTVPGSIYKGVVNGEQSSCGSGTLSGTSCSYNCSNSYTSSLTQSVDSKTSNSNYCSSSGTSTFSYTMPAFSFSANGYYTITTNYKTSASYTTSGPYNTKNYYCPTVSSIYLDGYIQYYHCTSNCSGSATGDTYYYATSGSCSDRYDYYVGGQTSSMGIRPVITVKEK